MTDPQETKSHQKRKHEMLSELYDSYYGMLLFYTKQLVRNAEVAKDIISEVFASMLKLSHDFQSVADAQAYLLVSCRNRAYNYLGAAHTTRSSTSLSAISDDWATDDTIHEEMVRLELLRTIYKEINALPTYARDILNLSFIKGLSNQEIAEELQKPVGNIRALKAQALKLLRLRIIEKKLTYTLLLLMLEEVAH